MWAAFGGDRPERPFLRVDVDAIYFHFTGGVKVVKDLYITGGVRRLALKYNVALGDLPEFERKPGVWDPLVGLGWHSYYNKLEVHATFEGGGFGVGTDVEYAGAFRLDWKPLSHFGLTGGYNYLYFKVSDERANRTFIVKQTLHGPAVGIGPDFEAAGIGRLEGPPYMAPSFRSSSISAFARSATDAIGRPDGDDLAVRAGSERGLAAPRSLRRPWRLRSRAAESRGRNRGAPRRATRCLQTGSARSTSAPCAMAALTASATRPSASILPPSSTLTPRRSGLRARRPCRPPAISGVVSYPSSTAADRRRRPRGPA